MPPGISCSFPQIGTKPNRAALCAEIPTVMSIGTEVDHADSSAKFPV